MKSEPSVYSIDDLQRDGTAEWEGVRNFQARNHMRAMRVGDLAFFYHSNATPPGIAGLMRICREAYPDDTQFDRRSKYFDRRSRSSKPAWDRVDVAFAARFDVLLPLHLLRDDPALQGMLVLKRGMRLSVQPVSEPHFRHILELAGTRPAQVQ
ncbi:MAG: EVE domain-containing protein [Proteobacteria bacterium]|nr:EVE domain-containing protein [Pseudomonadota bacterium]